MGSYLLVLSIIIFVILNSVDYIFLVFIRIAHNRFAFYQRKEGDDIHLAFLGDVAFRTQGGDLKYHLRVSSEAPFGKNVMSILRKSTLAFANLESSVVEDIESAKPLIVKKGLTKAQRPKAWFAASREDLHMLKFAGIDAVSVANNHWYDSGLSGSRICDIVENEGLECLGKSGVNARIFKDQSITVFTTNAALDVPYPCNNIDLSKQNVSSACLSSREAGGTFRQWKLDSKRVNNFLAQIEKEKQRGFIIIVQIHWGTQFQDEVESWQIQLAEDMFDAGANIIIGHHPHQLHGIASSKRGRGLVAYSLGSALWPYPNSERPSAILSLAINAKKSRIRACIQPTNMDYGVLRVLSEDESEIVMRKIDGLSKKLGKSFHGCDDFKI